MLNIDPVFNRSRNLNILVKLEYYMTIAHVLLCKVTTMHHLSIILMFFASGSSGAELTCHQPSFTCPNSSISCECQGVTIIAWEVRVTSAAPDRLFAGVFVSSDTEGSETSRNGFTAVLCNVTQDPPVHCFIITRLSSKLNFMLMESVMVECADNQGSATVLLQIASKLPV